jgi:osmotically-inducible protein OsmY
MTLISSCPTSFPRKFAHLVGARSVVAFLPLLLLGACTSLSNDPSRRTPGVVFDDTVVEAIVEREIRKSDAGYKGAHIVIQAFNGVVLIAGQVATDDLVTNAATVAKTINKVRTIHNVLTVSGPTSMVARSNDAWLTTKVKTRLITAKDADGTKIKVLTENSIVYLQGLVSRGQADDAVNVAKDIYGVQKIVKVFEYLD